MEKDPQQTKIEKEPEFVPDMKVDLVRHGKPFYTQEEYQTGQYEGRLTPEARINLIEKAHRLADSIDKDGEAVVFWVSPKRRAQETAQIFEEVFCERGINFVMKKSGAPKQVGSLRDVAISSEFLDNLDAEIKEGNIGSWDNWMEYWSRQKDLPEGTEGPDKVRSRVGRVITYLERIARTIKLPGKKLRFVCFGHEELFRDLLEEAYEQGTKFGEGPFYGETMEIGIKASGPEEESKAELLLNFRDKREKLEFDKKSRDFYKKLV